MATVTPNFNWPVPTSVDLVKDGAVAIEALGDAVDASLLDLKGGTTGQVLSKTSNTDMDFTWVAADDTNAIQNAIVDAKGDLIAATANDTPARLAVGNNGETLVADSSTSTGLRYTAGTVQSNPVLNSAMQVWQRGTSVAVSGAFALTYAADRWGFFRTGFATGMTVSRQVTGDATNLPFIQYGQRVQRDSGNTNTGVIYTIQNFESINSIPFAGKTVTFSFYAKAGANYSSASSALSYSVSTGTGTDQNLLNGFTGQANPLSGTATLTTTWQRFSGTATLSASATQIGLGFNYTPVGTAGANDWFEVTGVQIDIGSVALSFRTYAGTIQGELAAAQRYYCRFTPNGSTTAYLPATNFAVNATAAIGQYQFPQTMRISPTAVDGSSGGYLIDIATGGANLITSVTLNQSSNNVGTVLQNVASGLTTYRPYYYGGSGATSSFYVGFSAEL